MPTRAQCTPASEPVVPPSLQVSPDAHPGFPLYLLACSATRPTVLDPLLLLLLLLSPFALFQFSIPTIQSQPVNATPEHRTFRRKHRETRAKWRKELEEEEEWTLRTAFVALKMKATFPMRFELM